MDTEWKRRQGKEMVIDRKAVLLVKIETILERRYEEGEEDMRMRM